MTDIVEQKFWPHVTRGAPHECWAWGGAKMKKDGRGCVSLNGRTETAPRVAWFVAHGEWPPSHIFVCHTCDNPNCVNPSHLWLGNNAANMKDAARKGRLWAQVDSAQIKGERHGNAKLTVERIRAIRAKVRDGASQREVASEFGISQFTVWAICARVRWSHVE